MSATVCPLCRRPAEQPHTRCRAAVDEHLRQIPGLYRLLADVLEPGTTPSARVSGSRTPPLPARLEPLSLRGRGGITAILATWETDWRDLRGLPPLDGRRIPKKPPMPARAGVEQQLAGEHLVDELAAFLRAHLDWAVDHHQAIDEFAGDMRQIVDACYAALGVRNDRHRIGPCPTLDDSGTPCGRTLYADPYLDTIRCPRCHAEWPRARWLILGATLAGQPATSSRTDHAA